MYKGGMNRTEHSPSEGQEATLAPLPALPFDVNELVTEDDTPVDNLFSEKQQRLLTEPLYSSWAGPEPEAEGGGRRPFLVASNVGLFFAWREPPLVPDVFLSLDVEVPEQWHEKSYRYYFFWEFGKAPEVVVEIVSNREGNELGSKKQQYAHIGIAYYVVYDPTHQLGEETLYVFERRAGGYIARAERYLSGIGLGVTLWEGVYEGKQDTWLRWCDQHGRVIPTGAERAAQEAQRAERLAAKLRELGFDPDQIGS